MHKMRKRLLYWFNTIILYMYICIHTYKKIYMYLLYWLNTVTLFRSSFEKLEKTLCRLLYIWPYIGQMLDVLGFDFLWRGRLLLNIDMHTHKYIYINYDNTCIHTYIHIYIYIYIHIQACINIRIYVNMGNKCMSDFAPSLLYMYTHIHIYIYIYIYIYTYKYIHLHVYTVKKKFPLPQLRNFKWEYIYGSWVLLANTWPIAL